MKRILLTNTQTRYGLITIVLHWLMAVTILGLFLLGLYMVSLDYYSPWYNRAPFIHKSIGLLLAAILFFRIVWRILIQSPTSVDASTLVRRIAGSVHLILYLLMTGLLVSGYLIASADNRMISVFDWFSVPGFNLGIENQEDIAGEVHEIIAWTLIITAALHGLAALKHHFIDKDQTLKRMLGL